MENEKIEALLVKVPELYKNTMKKAWSKNKSRSVAMKAKCLDCVNFEDVRHNIGQCKSITCPLHQFRPFQNYSE